MATYSAQCSAVGSFGYANYFKLYVVLKEVNVSASNNTSQIQYNVYCQSSGSGSINARHLKYFNLNGSDIINTTETVKVSSPNAYIPIASGTTGAIIHNSDGSKSVPFSAKIQGATYGVSAYISGTFLLTTVARYTTVTSSVRSKTINSISINWKTTDARDHTQYSLNGGAWIDAGDSVSGGTITPDNKSGYYTIKGLSPNTTYTVKTRCKRTDSQLWSESSTISVTTYDIAKISSLNNFEHGSNPTVGVTNPGSIGNLSLVMKVGDTQILSRTVSAGNNAVSFSDTELDNLYKKYGSSNSLTATFVLSGSGYTNSKTCTITLKGNQKTIRTNVSGAWKRGKLWTNVNGTWKRGVLWTNVSGTWKRGI